GPRVKAPVKAPASSWCTTTEQTEDTFEPLGDGGRRGFCHRRFIRTEQSGLTRTPRLALQHLVGSGVFCRLVRRRPGEAGGVHGGVQGLDTHGTRARKPG